MQPDVPRLRHQTGGRGAGAQLAAAAVHILARGMAQLGQHAALVQRARHRGGALPGRAAERAIAAARSQDGRR